jgi:PAS domain S-box-containing protein
MKTDSAKVRLRDESPSAGLSPLSDNPSMFQLHFERSADAIWLFDPQAGVFVDGNQAAVELMRAGTKERLLRMRPEDLSPPFQADGTPSSEKTIEIVALIEQHGGLRFEWLARRFDGQDVPLEVVATPIRAQGRTLHVIVSRDITERKRAERELVELNQSLERRVAERTAALSTSEAQFRALVEHAPEAIVVFDGDTGRFLFGNEHACVLYGVPMEKLAELTPADVSPEFQPNGRRSGELAREIMNEALAGGTAVFEWIHRQPDGKLIPT